MPPTSATVVETSAFERSSRAMTTAASSWACTSSAESIATSGCMPPASAMAVPLSDDPDRCQSVRAAYSCVSSVPRETSSITGGMPFERAISACSSSLLVAIASRACAASFCASALKERESRPPESHMISGGTAPALAKAVWLAELPLLSCCTAPSTRTAPPGVFIMAARELSRATISRAMISRLSGCLAASELRAPIEALNEASVAPLTSKMTRGSMPPSLAIVALLGALSAESDQRPAALCSLTSSVSPSRTRAHIGAMAPVRATAAWLAGLECESSESASAALACSCGLGEPSMATSGWMAPASAIWFWFSRLPSASWETACAASEQRVAATAISLTLVEAETSTLARSGMPPASAIAVWMSRLL